MKICLRCGHLGDDEYCPACRKTGTIRKMKTAQQMTFYLGQELRKVEILQARIKALEGA